MLLRPLRLFRSLLPATFAVLLAAASPAGAAVPVAPDNGPQLVFESVRIEAADGSVLDARVIGDLDDAAAQRAARPWSYLDEDWIFDEESWSRSLGDGATEHGYRVTRRRNEGPVKAQVVLAPPAVDPRLQDALAAAAPDTLLPLTISVRGLAEWNVPLRVAPFTRSGQDRERLDAERQSALDARAARADDLTRALAREIEDAGGRVVARGRHSAYLLASVPARLVRALTMRSALSSLLLTDQVPAPAATPLDVARANTHLDAKGFIDAGYDGDEPNAGRHGFGDITVGVIESNDVLEDEGCFLYDGAGCGGVSRLEARYRCDDIDRDGNYCEPTSNFRETDENSSHGTAVASTILADYRQGQGDPYQLGDPNWTPALGHDAAWEDARTGIAPEARLIFFGQMSDNEPDLGLTISAALADSFADAVTLNVDIANGSWTSGTGCDGLATSAAEQELENAFDDGILAVMSAGNFNQPVCSDVGFTTCASNADCTTAGVAGPCSSVCDNDRTVSCTANSDCDAAGAAGDCGGPKVCMGNPGAACDVDADCGFGATCRAATTACNIGAPADVEKAFAVNSLNGAHDPCEVDQLDCLGDAEYSANGGFDAVVNGITCTGCVSGADIAAPDRVSGVTFPGGEFGSPGGTFNGTSAAGPVVAGAAALVKDWYLAKGNTFINSPGRLHTVMLSMGDRLNSSWGTSSAFYGRIAPHDVYGVGRLKLRLLEDGHGFGPWGTNLSIYTFTSSTPDIVYIPFRFTLPARTRMVKCVLFQAEDMSPPKTDYSRIDLELRLLQALAPDCSSTGVAVNTRINSGYDPKKYAAWEEGDATMEGRCLEVTLDREHVTPGGITAQVFCYYAGLLDREPSTN